MKFTVSSVAWLTQRKIFEEWQQLLNNLLNVASNIMGNPVKCRESGKCNCLVINWIKK